jgi:choline dehydrogenase-like flavoprotein
VIRDPIREGLAAGWKVTDAAALDRDLALEADVAIVGTGAGGGVTAEILAAAGLEVVLIEEGALRSSGDFHMLEAEAYPQLYQESAARKTLDKAITILQGRCVGGSTTVNWTSSFRTPDSTLGYWSASASPTFRRRRSRPGSSGWRSGSRSGRGRCRRTRTMRCSRAARRSSASQPVPSGATSAGAGTSATAGWVARRTQSSRCS